MREHLPKVIIVGLLLLVVGVPFALRPTATTGTQNAAATDVLVVITPHNEQIRHEIDRAFNQWRAEQGKGPVRFDWRASGGTSDLRKHVIAQFEAAAKQQRENAGIGTDLFFGGGDYEHNRLAAGFDVQRDGQQVHIDIIIPPSLPEGLLEAAFPGPTIGGERLYHPDLKWVGVVLSSFGIVYNRDVLEMLGVPEPTTWADLGDPRLAGQVALADPGHSGSIASTYHVILRRAGWADGWALLRRAFANARYFTASSSKVPVDVSAGDAAAGMCIDFYGRFQAGAVGGDRVGYVDPPFMTAITADPISIVRGAPHHELANEFVVWLLSDHAQQLWQLRKDAPGGPEQFELRRQPVRRDAYTDANRADWADPQIDPFGTAR